MQKSNYTLILASQSPRRKELLGWLDVPFEVTPSDVEEKSSASDAVSFCEDIAAQKGLDVWKKSEHRHDAPVVISADTMVFLGDEKMGKPSDRAQAKEMLLRLSGKTHQVLTSVFMKSRERQDVFTVSSSVTFDHIDEVTMEKYLDSGESLDKAGAYGIQGKGLTFIKKVEGSYSNVVGFPLCEFRSRFESFLASEPKENWRELFAQ